MAGNNSKIIRAPNLLEFEKILRNACNTTLVVFDIDEVIFTSKDQVLHPSYKKYRDVFEQKLVENIGNIQAPALISLVYKMRQRALVDPKILEIFDLLSRKNIMTIALTHCTTGKVTEDATYEELRIAQLESFNVDFDRLSNYLGEIRLPDLERNYGVPLLYKGVILTGFVDKGIVLQQILEKINFKPKEIIFIDDRLENIMSVQSICLELKIKFIGLEYTVVKDTPRSEFNQARAQVQFETLAKERIWLSDKEAGERLKSK